MWRHYVDDICGFSLPSESHSKFITIKKLIENLGLDILLKKLIPPSTKTYCLGVVFDTTNFTMSIPEDKLEKIKNAIGIGIIVLKRASVIAEIIIIHFKMC